MAYKYMMQIILYINKLTLTHTQLSEGLMKNFCHCPTYFGAVKTPSSGNILRNHTEDCDVVSSLRFLSVFPEDGVLIAPKCVRL